MSWLRWKVSVGRHVPIVLTILAYCLRKTTYVTSNRHRCAASLAWAKVHWTY